MILVSEIREWLDTLNDTDEVGIDDGGLILRAPDAYLEIGGLVITNDEE